jgi:hypothetical protein
MMLFLDEIEQFSGKVVDAGLQDCVQALGKRVAQLRDLTGWLLAQGEQSPHGLGAAACDYLHAVGYVAYGYMWLRMMAVACAQTSAFAATKLKTGRYFFNRVLPRMEGLLACLQGGDVDMMALSVDEF